ncbi:hypothetical protein OAL32_03420 [Synechococcus sp. AH-551-G15]|nr:hypothetical protein [Synechococcus sp. AH-551-G15]
MTTKSNLNDPRVVDAIKRQQENNKTDPFAGIFDSVVPPDFEWCIIYDDDGNLLEDPYYVPHQFVEKNQ